MHFINIRIKNSIFNRIRFIDDSVLAAQSLGTNETRFSSSCLPTYVFPLNITHMKGSKDMLRGYRFPSGRDGAGGKLNDGVINFMLSPANWLPLGCVLLWHNMSDSIVVVSNVEALHDIV